jgi:hypothetical protein
LFIRQNEGTLPRKRREGEFKQLRDDEVRAVEGIVADAFIGFEDTPGQREPCRPGGWPS